MEKKIDNLGRIVIPKKMLTELNWEIEDFVELIPDKISNTIMMKKAEESCFLCGKKTELRKTPKKDLRICKECLRELTHKSL